MSPWFVLIVAIDVGEVIPLLCQRLEAIVLDKD